MLDDPAFGPRRRSLLRVPGCPSSYGPTRAFGASCHRDRWFSGSFILDASLGHAYICPALSLSLSLSLLPSPFECPSCLAMCPSCPAMCPSCPATCPCSSRCPSCLSNSPSPSLELWIASPHSGSRCYGTTPLLKRSISLPLFLSPAFNPLDSPLCHPLTRWPKRCECCSPESCYAYESSCETKSEDRTSATPSA